MHEETIRRLVKEIDPRFDCSVDMGSGMVDVTRRSPLGNISLFDRVHLSSIDRAYFEHMRKVIYINIHGDIERHVQESEKRQERRSEREMSNLSEDIAKDLRKPLRHAIDHGEL
jgi:hypothetical protein